MRAAEANLMWLENPEVFCVNREDAHSDHRYYETRREMEMGKMRLCQSLDGVWKFSYAKNPGERQKDFYKEGFDFSSFSEIVVPGHMEMQGYGNCQYANVQYPWDGVDELRPPKVSWERNPVGSYVRRFDVDDVLMGKRLFLSFAGVESAFYVWLNGVFVGYGEDSFTPSEFEVTDIIKEKGNLLAVEVYKRSSASWLEDQDFFRFSGIFRSVTLKAIPKSHIADIFIKPGLKEDNTTGVLKIEAKGTGELPAYANMVLKKKDGSECFCIELKPEKKAEKAEEADRSTAEETAGSAEGAAETCSDWTLCAETEVENCRPWSAEEPYLYTLEIELFDGSGDTAEVLGEKIGFRRFEMKDGVMQLNGKRIVFKGVNRHEFSAKNGRVVTEEEMLWDIRFMKRHNINAVRTCHYPNQSRWYELCDLYGIYLIDETNLETHGSWNKMGVTDPSWNVPGSLLEWKAAVLDRAKSMLERDKNHPSILIWSCGNESYAGEDILAMSEFFHERDNSRLVHYEGVFWNREFERISDMESQMYTRPHDVEAYLQNDPKKPFLLCEYMHAMGNSLGGMKEYTDLADKYPMYQGGFIWDYVDQAIAYKKEDGSEVLGYGGDFDDRPNDFNFCGDGIVYGNRKETPKAAEAKALYQNLELIPDAGGFLLKNKNLFIGTDNQIFVYRILQNGKPVCETKLTALVMPQEEKYIALDGTLGSMVQSFLEQDGEVVAQVSARLFQDCLWAEAGFEIAFGQAILKAAKEKQREQADTAFEIVHGDVHLGIRGNGFFAMFSKNDGSLISLCYDGKEYITRPPVPTFWRGTTDNDHGCKFDFKSAVWMGPEMFRALDTMEITEGKDCVKVVSRYSFPVVSGVKVEMTYVVDETGRIEVKAQYFGVKGTPEFPLFGVKFCMRSEFSNLCWYGLGPEETYPDRLAAGRIGIFESTAADSMCPYLMPQDCGNHMDTRILEVTNKKKEGLRFTMLDKPFAFSALPYSAMELENALHQEELPPVSYTYVNVLGAVRGVGGDDSWGAVVHPQYCLNAEEDICFRFAVEKAEGNIES